MQNYSSMAAIFLLLVTGGISSWGQTPAGAADDRAGEILSKAIEAVGGQRYLNARTQIGHGKYSVIRDGAVVSFQSFIDILVYPDRERTEFKGGGTKTVQVNAGTTGWTFDSNNELIKSQGDVQIADFQRGLRVSLDNLLRGYWRGSAALTYVGKRPATLGKRNDVLKLTYKDGLVVEFEFGMDDGLPAKAIYKRLGPDNAEMIEEDRYAQFIELNGITTPFVIDHFSAGRQSSRINYESIEFNRSVADSIFTKPANPKELRKDVKP